MIIPSQENPDIMSFELTGTLIKKYDTEQKTESFKAREFVVEYNPSGYQQFIKFQLVQDRVSLIDNFNEGQQVKISFDLRGRKWTDPKSGEDKYFGNLNAWRVEAPVSAQGNSGAPDSAYINNGGAPQGSSASTQNTGDQEFPTMDEDDLPF